MSMEACKHGDAVVVYDSYNSSRILPCPYCEEVTGLRNDIAALKAELAETKQILYDTEYGDDL
jgi:hypothetical protein